MKVIGPGRDGEKCLRAMDMREEGLSIGRMLLWTGQGGGKYCKKAIGKVKVYMGIKQPH